MIKSKRGGTLLGVALGILLMVILFLFFPNSFIKIINWVLKVTGR